MANEPIIFIFTCVKNGRKYINKLFNSLIEQSDKRFVHYIYEDGSQFPLDELVTTYIQKVNGLDCPYKIIYEKNSVNKGLNFSTQHCISKCYLPYFTWIDCDNWVSKNFIEQMISSIELHKHCICFRSNAYYSINNDIKKEFDYFENKFPNCTKKRRYLKDILKGSYLFSHTVVNYKFYLNINKKNVLIPNKSFFNDVQIMTICSLTNKKFYYVKNAINFVLIHSDSVSKEFSKSETFDFANFFDLFNALHIPFKKINHYKKYLELYKKQKDLFEANKFSKLFFFTIFKIFYLFFSGWGIKSNSFYRNDAYWIIKSLLLAIHLH